MRDVKAAMVNACDQAAKLLLDEMRQLTSRIDHDLNALARMGHPYGWGKDRFGNERVPGRPHPDWIVHIQDGKLQAGLTKNPAYLSGNQIEAQILSKSPYTWYLLLGTRLMRPRDFVSSAIILRQNEVQKIFERAFLAVHDRVVGTVEPLEIHLLEHDEFPAQLPGG